MPVVWHPARWWNWFVPEEKKKEIELLTMATHHPLIYMNLYQHAKNQLIPSVHS